MAELSLARCFTVRPRLRTGVKQRKRGLRWGCGAKLVLSSTMSGSTVGKAKKAGFPVPKIWAPGPGRFGTLLGLVLGMPFPCSLSEVRRLFRRVSLYRSNVHGADCRRHSKFVEHPPGAKPWLTTKNERSE